MGRQQAAVVALVECGANADQPGMWLITPLMWAVGVNPWREAEGDIGMVKLLLALGADHAAVAGYGQEGTTALDCAESQEEIAAVLREWAERHTDERYRHEFAAQIEALRGRAKPGLKATVRRLLGARPS